MKKILFLLWLLPAACFAQTDSTQVKPHDLYCRLFMISRAFSSKITVEYDFGRDTSAGNLSDTEFKRLSNKLNQFDNQIDALNYMAAQGWEVINYTGASPLANPSYLLRKKPSA